VGYRIPASDVPSAIERLLKTYQSLREPEENLRAYFARHSNEELRAQLAGEPLAAVARDTAGPEPGPDA
jgi:sulfite reductase (ferredoxin)